MGVPPMKTTGKMSVVLPNSLSALTPNSLFPEPEADGTPMRIEAFNFAEGFKDRE